MLRVTVETGVTLSQVSLESLNVVFVLLIIVVLDKLELKAVLVTDYVEEAL